MANWSDGHPAASPLAKTEVHIFTGVKGCENVTGENIDIER